MKKIERVGGLVLLILIMVFAILWKAQDTSEIEELRKVLKSESPGLFDRAMSRLSSEYRRIEQGKIDLEIKRQLTEGLKEQKRQKELQSSIALIPWKAQAYQILCYAGFSTLFFCTIAISLGYTRRHGIVEQQLDEKTILRIRHKDLPKMIHIANGIMAARQLAASGNSENMQRSMELNRLLFEAAKTGLTGKIALPEPTNTMKDVTPLNAHIPQFSELLHNGVIAPASPLIFGYEPTGEAEKGDLKRLYSTIVLGATGQGKTSFLTGLVAQSIICENAEFHILDPHSGDDESLISSLGDLVKLPNIKEINPMEAFVRDELHKINARFEDRLAQREAKTPFIFMIDELPVFLDPEVCPYAKYLKKVIFKLISQGRKLRMFFMGASTTSLAEALGRSSLIKSALSSSFVFHCNRKVAQGLLQDKQEVDKVKAIKGKGVCLFSPTEGESKILKIPFATRNDMQDVYEIVTRQVANGPSISVVSSGPVDLTKSADFPHVSQEISQGEGNFSTITNGISQVGNVIDFPQKAGQDEIVEEEIDLISQIRDWLKCDENTQKDLAREIGKSESFLSKILNGSKPISQELQGKLQTFFNGKFEGNLEEFIPPC